jgi:hypothetical protein
MRSLCYAETTPALVMEPPQHSVDRGIRYDTQVSQSCDLTSPSIALSWVCYLSGSILRGFDPLTLVGYPRSRCLLVQRFPAHPPHVPLRANRYAQGLSASSPAPPVV